MVGWPQPLTTHDPVDDVVRFYRTKLTAYKERAHRKADDIPSGKIVRFDGEKDSLTVTVDAPGHETHPSIYITTH